MSVHTAEKGAADVACRCLVYMGQRLVWCQEHLIEATRVIPPGASPAEIGRARAATWPPIGDAQALEAARILASNPAMYRDGQQSGPAVYDESQEWKP